MTRRNLLLLTAALASLLFIADATRAQDSRASARAGARAQADASALDIASGTRLAAQLQQALDVRQARVGDRVILKTTEALKSGGETVVKKGARLVGHVADVQRSARGAAESSLTLVFDRLESGSLTTPITATVNSVTQARAAAHHDDDETSLGASARADTRAQASGQKNSGGLLGDPLGAVGGVVDSTTRAAGETVGGATRTAGSAVGRLGRIRVTESLDASISGGSTLSLAGGDLRLEKGTTFNLTLSQSAGVDN
jgi:hypothetical protein